MDKLLPQTDRTWEHRIVGTLEKHIWRQEDCRTLCHVPIICQINIMDGSIKTIYIITVQFNQTDPM